MESQKEILDIFDFRIWFIFISQKIWDIDQVIIRIAFTLLNYSNSLDILCASKRTALLLCRTSWPSSWSHTLSSAHVQVAFSISQASRLLHSLLRRDFSWGLILNNFRLFHSLGSVVCSLIHNHLIFVEIPSEDSAIFVGINSESLLQVILPLAFIFSTIAVIEDTNAISEPILPWSLISISQELTIASGLYPDMGTPAFLSIVNPTTIIFLLGSLPEHGSLAFLLVIFPFTIVVISTRIGHSTFTMLHTSLEFAFVFCPWFECHDTISMPQTVFPISIIYAIFTRSCIDSLAFSQTLFDFSFIPGTIRPFVFSTSCYLIILELPSEFDTIWPEKGTLAM